MNKGNVKIMSKIEVQLSSILLLNQLVFRIDKILYIPGCPSVGWSVGRSVCLLIEIQSIEATGLKLGG